MLDLFSADMERYYLEPWFWLSILLLIILTAINIRYRTRKRKAAQAHVETNAEKNSAGGSTTGGSEKNEKEIGPGAPL